MLEDSGGGGHGFVVVSGYGFGNGFVLVVGVGFVMGLCRWWYGCGSGCCWWPQSTGCVLAP